MSPHKIKHKPYHFRPHVALSASLTSQSWAPLSRVANQPMNNACEMGFPMRRVGTNKPGRTECVWPKA
jgi:hypothetical protein